MPPGDPGWWGAKVSLVRALKHINSFGTPYTHQAVEEGMRAPLAHLPQATGRPVRGYKGPFCVCSLCLRPAHVSLESAAVNAFRRERDAPGKALKDAAIAYFGLLHPYTGLPGPDGAVFWGRLAAFEAPPPPPRRASPFARFGSVTPAAQTRAFKMKK